MSDAFVWFHNSSSKPTEATVFYEKLLGWKTTEGPAGMTAPRDGRDRVVTVLRTIHLIFNEGYWSARDDAPIRADLCRLAIGLARTTVEAFPDHAEAAGLLSLVLLHDARRVARIDPDGDPVPLPGQDRMRWDRDAIVAATALLDRALAVGRPGPFQIEAAIAAAHCRARTAEDTDWSEVAFTAAVMSAARGECAYANSLRRAST